MQMLLVGVRVELWVFFFFFLNLKKVSFATPDLKQEQDGIPKPGRCRG